MAKFRFLLLFAAAFCFALGLLAEPVAFQLRPFNQSNGLPDESLMAIVSDRQGYLWMTSTSGLVRFDGVRFQMFSPENTPALRSNDFSFHALLEARDGSLWAGTHNAGIVHYDHGRFTTIGVAQGLPGNEVVRIDEDSAGDVWIYTPDGLARWHSGRLEKLDFQRYLGPSKNQFGFDGNHIGLWRTAGNQIERYAYGKWTSFPLPDGMGPGQLHIRSIYEDSKRRVWYSLLERRGDYYLVENGRLQAFHGLPPDAFVSWQDRYGGLWITDHHGQSAIWKDGNSVPLPLATPVFFNIVEAAPGTLWIATATNGLFRGQAAMFSLIPQSGAPEVEASLLLDRDHHVWVGSDSLQQLNANGLSRKAELWDRRHFSYLNSLTQRANGEIIAAAPEGIYRLSKGVLLPVGQQASGVDHAIEEWEDGTLWAGGARGLAQVSRDRTEYLPHVDRDVGPADVSSMLREAWGYWVGTDRGLTRLQLKDQRKWEFYAGWSYGAVLCLYRDSSGTVWIGTESQGLIRLQGGRLTQFTVRNGLPGDRVASIVEDRLSDVRSLWLQTSGGLASAEIELLDASAVDAGNIRWSLVNRNDGLPSRPTATPGQLRALQDADGNLLFATPTAIVALRPERVPDSSQPPRVYIEGYEIDGAKGDTEGKITLRPGQSQLRIDYTAVTPWRPENVRFVARIAGLDSAWTELGTQRSALFTHLPSGDFVFELKGVHAAGDAPGNLASIPIHVVPRFYQRRWLQVLFLSLFLAAVTWLLIFLELRARRVNQLQRAFAQRLMASQESERKRIAADLHDGLGQHLVLINNLSLLAKDGDVPAKEQELFSRIEEQTGQALGELRTISYNLRPYQLDRMGITHAIEALAEAANASFTGTISVSLENIDGLIPTHLEIALYRIAQESLNNVVKHSKATAASIALHVERAAVYMTVKDNGCGISAKTDSRGFGLLGMQERATLLEGTLSVLPDLLGGTIVTLIIPLRMK